jgi:5-(carboxyamino)imidazole ribonucleotide synthase
LRRFSSFFGRCQTPTKTHLLSLRAAAGMKAINAFMLTFIVSSRAKQLKFNNMNYFSSAFKLGILGGGQLGKMLLAETRKYDIQTYILDPSADAPAQFGAHYFEKGDLLDFNTVYLFGKRVDLLTIEIENVNLDALDQLESEGLKVFPSPKTLRKIQSKIDQKKIYITNQIPTAPALFFENKQQVLEAINNHQVTLTQVWKQDRFGYDGYGVKILKNQQEAGNILDTPALISRYCGAFCNW